MEITLEERKQLAKHIVEYLQQIQVLKIDPTTKAWNRKPVGHSVCLSMIHKDAGKDALIAET